MREKGRERRSENLRVWERKSHDQAEEGWTRVRGRKQDRITSYFFTCFPENFGKEAMWGIFQRYDKVWDLFISDRRDKNGRRFGFVRFRDVQNPLDLERRLDQIVIGASKIHVNLPKYTKVDRQQAITVTQTDYAATRRDHPATRRYHAATRRDIGGEATVHGNGRGKISSYAQAVMAGSKATKGWVRKRPEGETKKEEGKNMAALELWHGPEIPKGEDWLQRSMVGTIKNLDTIPLLQDAFMLEGNATVQVRYMGDDLVLITGPEGVELEGILQEAEEWLKEFVVKLQPWSPSIAFTCRVTWVRCYGVPLNLWSLECFKYLTCPVGNIIKMDEGTSMFTTLEHARMQIRTTALEPISLTRKMMIDGITHTIRIT
ncbi:uncharacterized protein LOC130725766 [Lotus japonicus]|uniref:uncharacterized protein LOC130725766 n=1 Tax=Lotus japonicus TaxID=34305 RepID=UPI00258AB586|nr:uncharacterized protein LOC130725766 [Lotus japonicus]